EKALPFEEARLHEENAKKAAATDYDDATFNLLFKDELQEREFARVLLEYGTKKWDEERLIADYVFSEILDESLFDNPEIIKLINTYRQAIQQDTQLAAKSFFIYHPDTTISAMTVSLLNFPYEESSHWRKEYSQSTGYQKQLFEQSYEHFIRSLAPGNEEQLMRYLKMDEDKTNYEVQSAIDYLQLRKIKRMILENQVDMEKPHSQEEYETLHKTHEHLKQLEMELSQKMGTVIIK
ncbi:MAG: DNA primase, partial [Bacteroidetes bacterium]|nr:DNA primase [Bacteroidota bacterium]